MRTHTLLTKAASMAVCFGILLSGPVSAFGGSSSRAVRDVELSQDGTLHGRVVSAEGQVIHDAVVELRYEGNAVARTASSSSGEFAITGVRGGVHELAVGSASSSVRLWQNGTAPQGAVSGILVTGSESVVRAQNYDPYCDPGATCAPSSGFGLIDLVTLTMLGTSTAALIIAIDTNNDIDDLTDNIGSP